MLFMSSVLILAAEEADEPSGAKLLFPEPAELVAGIIAAAIIFFFVWKWVLPQINKILEARQAAIRSDLEAAEKSKLEAQSLLSDYQTQIAGARDEANRIVEEARQAADKVRADIVAKAEHEATAIKQRAQADLAGERERAESAIRREVADLSLAVAEKVVGSALDNDAQRALVDRYIEELGSVKN
jgi:F-type H+-transporting ATPase subunit b